MLLLIREKKTPVFRSPSAGPRDQSGMSSGQLPLPYPPSVTAEELDSLVQAAKDWSTANGLCVRPPLSVAPPETDPAGVLATSAPVALFPSTFPLLCFEQGQAVQQAYNELYAKVAQDEGFIGQMVDEYEMLPLFPFVAKEKGIYCPRHANSPG